MLGDDMTVGDDPQPVERTDDANLAMRVLCRHAVVVSIEPDQRQAVRLPIDNTSRLEAVVRNREHRLAIFFKPFGLRPGLAPQLAIKVLAAIVGELPIELLEVVELGDGHHEIAPCEADKVLRVALLVRTTHETEMVIVKVVRLQSQEFSRRLFASLPNNLRHGDLRIIVADPLRHAAEELERANVACLEGLGAFTGKRLAEERVAVGQRHDAEHDLDLTTTIDGLRLAEVELGFTRRMRQRHEHFRRRLFVASDLVTDDSDLARVVVLVAESLEDPLARMSLFPMDLLVGLENLVNHRDEGSNLWLVSCVLLGMVWRFRMFQNLLDRPEIQIVLQAGLPPAHLVDKYVASDSRPLIHVLNHSFPSRS
jgi:hypothetical protein